MSDTKYLFELLGAPVGWLELLVFLLIIFTIVKILSYRKLKLLIINLKPSLISDFKPTLDLNPVALIQIAEQARKEEQSRLDRQASEAQRIADDLTAKANSSKGMPP